MRCGSRFTGICSTRIGSRVYIGRKSNFGYLVCAEFGFRFIRIRHYSAAQVHRRAQFEGHCLLRKCTRERALKIGFYFRRSGDE
jgi:hypothetical protein